MVEFSQGLESTSVSFFLVFEHPSHAISLIQFWQNIGSNASHHCVLCGISEDLDQNIGLLLILLDKTMWVSYCRSCQYNEGSALIAENNNPKISLYLCISLIYFNRFLWISTCAKCLLSNCRACPVPFYSFCFPSTKMFSGFGGLPEILNNKVLLKYIQTIDWLLSIQLLMINLVPGTHNNISCMSSKKKS